MNQAPKQHIADAVQHHLAGDLEQAAAAYLAAGRVLLERGDRAAAEHLVVVLQGLNQAHARSLADALEQPPGSDNQ